MPNSHKMGQSDSEESAGPAARGARAGAVPLPLEQRPRRYMVAALPPQQLSAAGIAAPALDLEALEQLLQEDPQVRVVRRVPAHRRAAADTAGVRPLPFPDIVVAEMTYDRARRLRQQFPQLHLERDRLLTYSQPEPTELRTPAPVTPLSEAVTFAFLVEDTDGNPVPNASVYVTGSGWPAYAKTGPTGEATVALPGETTETIRSVVVRPVSGHWSAWLERPALSTEQDNLITLQSLSESFPGFPAQPAFGWGHLAMHLHRLPPTFRAGGIKIALIDSGVSTEHPDLRDQIAGGLDLVDREERGWSVDTIYQGSRGAGIITGSDNGRGVIGVAVESLVYAVKIYPTGRLSDLIEALDHCIDNEIDIANVGLSASRPSPLVGAKIEEARQAGVACIAAAGDGGGPVAFPGNLPTVLTVAAIGKAGTFPAGSSHAAEVFGPQTAEGYFSPRFTCHGPEVDVCAPGVAILSVAPPDGYAVWDGTFLAAAHITGIAALALAHHGDFGNGFSQRNASRVDHLFQLIKNSCTPLDLGDPSRTGAGLPDALRLLGPALAGIPAVPSEVLNLLDQLTTEMIQAGLLQGPPSLTLEGLSQAQAVTPRTLPGTAPPARVEQLTAPGRTALAWLAEEMRVAGLLEEFPDPLE